MSGMPTNNDQSPAMPDDQDTSQGQGGAAQGDPLFAGHGSVHATQLRGYYNIPVQNQPRSLMPVQGNAQARQDDQVQQIYRDQLSFFARQQLTREARLLLTFLGSNPDAMDGLTRLFAAVVDQIATQDKARQLRQLPQSSNPAAPGEAPQAHRDAATPIIDETTAPNTETDANSGNAIAHPPLHAMDAIRAIQDRANVLIGQPATTYKGYLQNDAEFALYEKAVWKAKRKDNDIENKCQGYPTDTAGKMRVKERIFAAIQNMEGEQDPASDSGDFENSVAVRTVKALSGLETEILAHKLMEDMRKVQSGGCLLCLPGEYKIVQEATFTDKLDQVVEALKYNKPLCRSATTTAEWIARIAADPVGERHKKNQNNKNNKDKAGVLKKEAAARGKSRRKGLRMKRFAPEDSGTDTTHAILNSGRGTASSSSGGSAKRQRTSLAQTHGEASQQHRGQQAEVATPRLSPEQLAQLAQFVDAADDEVYGAQHSTDD